MQSDEGWVKWRRADSEESSERERVDTRMQNAVVCGTVEREERKKAGKVEVSSAGGGGS